MNRLPFPPSTGRIYPELGTEELARLLGADRNWLAGSLTQHGRRFVSGEISGLEFQQISALLLQHAHTQAASIGTAMAGLPVNHVSTFLIGNRVGLSQEGFFTDFIADLEKGRYRSRSKGGKGAAARNARFDMYARRLVGTANQAWLDGIKRLGVRVRWVYGSTIEHCKTCQYETSLGWRLARSLTRVPGDGSTDCIIFCGCHLETENGMRSPSLGDFAHRGRTATPKVGEEAPSMISAAIVAMAAIRHRRQGPSADMHASAGG